MAMKHMTDLQTVQVNNLIEKAGQNGSRIVKQSTSDPVLYLDRLAAIFRHVSIELQPGQPHPAAQLAIEGKLQKVAEKLHAVLLRKQEENGGHFRHALGWYVMKLAGGHRDVDHRVLEKFYLDNFDPVITNSN